MQDENQQTNEAAAELGRGRSRRSSPQAEAPAPEVRPKLRRPSTRVVGPRRTSRRRTWACGDRGGGNRDA